MKINRTYFLMDLLVRLKVGSRIELNLAYVANKRFLPCMDSSVSLQIANLEIKVKF